MRKLTRTVLALCVMASLAMVSCKDKDVQDTETEMIETEGVDNTDVSDEPYMDTIVTDDDTIVKTGGGTNENPAGDQVP